jgi:hypothetical protein
MKFWFLSATQKDVQMAKRKKKSKKGLNVTENDKAL